MQNSKMAVNRKSFLEITEQPRSVAYFRNESEVAKEKKGCIGGKSRGKTLPTIKVKNAKEKMTVVVTPLNPENGEIHFIRLLRQDRKSLSKEIMDPCVFDLSKKNNYTEKLKLAIMIPGKNSSFLRPATKKNLSKIILNFELFDEHGNKVHEIKSDPISNIRNKLEIKKMSAEEGSVEGDQNIWIVCNRLQLRNNNIEVRFSKDNWETYVKVTETLNQDLLIIHSPPFCNQNITEPVTVDVQVINHSDGIISEKFKFTYQPRLENYSAPSEYDTNVYQSLSENTAPNDLVSVNPYIYPENISADIQSYNACDYMVDCWNNIFHNSTEEERSNDDQLIFHNDSSNLICKSDSNIPYNAASENNGYYENFVHEEFQTKPIEFSLETFDKYYYNM